MLAEGRQNCTKSVVLILLHSALPCTNGSIRLADGATPESAGEVEVCSGGEWGTENIEESDVEEICTTLGFQRPVGA